MADFVYFYLQFKFSVFNAQFTSDKVSKELEYFQTKWGESFERTYGWAWLLKLQVWGKKLNVDDPINNMKVGWAGWIWKARWNSMGYYIETTYEWNRIKLERFPSKTSLPNSSWGAHQYCFRTLPGYWLYEVNISGQQTYWIMISTISSYF